jgi:hypothetical protein
MCPVSMPSWFDYQNQITSFKTKLELVECEKSKENLKIRVIYTDISYYKNQKRILPLGCMSQSHIFGSQKNNYKLFYSVYTLTLSIRNAVRSSRAMLLFLLRPRLLYMRAFSVG